MLLISLLLIMAPAKASAQDAAEPVRKIALTDSSRTITLRVAPNAVTSVRFNRSLDKERIVCGDNQNFIVAAQGGTVSAVGSDGLTTGHGNYIYVDAGGGFGCGSAELIGWFPYRGTSVRTTK